MSFDVAGLHQELVAAGLRIHGCASDGRIDWIAPPTQAEQNTAAAVLAAHDPQRREREDLADRDRLVALAGRLEAGTATPAESSEALARLIRRIVQ